MLWLGKLFGVLVVVALTNLDLYKLGLDISWGLFALLFAGLLLALVEGPVCSLD